MILISNSQRDSAVRLLNMLSDTVDRKTVKGSNTRRMARKLSRTLSEKEPISKASVNPQSEGR